MALAKNAIESISDEGEAEFLLRECSAVAKLPATDIDRARRFYAEQLGLTSYPGASPGHYIYECGGSRFIVYESRVRASGTHDQIAFIVPDLETVVRQLKAGGVVFEVHDEPGAARFKDSEGNLLNLKEIPSCVVRQ